MKKKGKERKKHVVVGTAGHVDHGKTSLVRALTGVYTDRLKEERKRGMSIEVGFAPYRLSSGQVVSIIDVPGHERFIKNMLRGISGIDIGLLVIAADDGPMPQTREHLDILRLLDIQKGVVVISKTDLVDDELLELAAEEIMALLKGTFLENTLPVYYSSQTNQGLPQVKEALKDACNKVEEKNMHEGFRLPIDRVFTLAGHGTVVTGTIASGKIREGNKVQIYPTHITAKVKKVQVHNQDLCKADAGQRVGINLSRVKPDILKRGMVLGEPEALIPTHLVNARFNYLISNGNTPLKNKTRVRVYCGTNEVIGRMVFMDKEELLPGDDCLVQFRLEERIVPLPFDRYIVRSLSPVTTIGGGIVFEVAPPKYRKYDPNPIYFIELIEKKNNHKAIEWLVKKGEYQGAALSKIRQKLRLEKLELDNMINSLIRKKRLICTEHESVIHAECYETLKDELLKKLKAFHGDNPLQIAISKEALRANITPSPDIRVFDYTVQKLTNEQIIEVESGGIRLADQQIRLNPKQRSIVDGLENICKSSGFRSVDRLKIKKVFAGQSKAEISAILKFMAYENRVIKLKDGRLIHPNVMEEIKRLVKKHIQSRGKITPQECRNLLDVGRDIFIPIMEYLDDIKFTIRIGNYRVLYPEKGVSLRHMTSLSQPSSYIKANRA
ncbi:MAG: selenocysteine-specific translation elongation factor [Thermodesulfobacteriota bacterium]|nr:selenocysteine-specific translation elongation factor [Thermodesulfobacteriota bacterium]